MSFYKGENMNTRQNYFARIILAIVVCVGLIASASGAASAKPSTESQWCECVIFALNYFNLAPLPQDINSPYNDFNHAYRLTEKNKAGYSWMDYQGFGRRTQRPYPGDIILMQRNAVHYSMDVSNSQLNTNSADSQSGHIGVVDSVQPVTYKNVSYWLISMRSSNYTAGRASSQSDQSKCNNVTVAPIYVPVNSQEISYWGKSYQIVNSSSGKALDVNGASQKSGAPIIQYIPHGGYNQKWLLESFGYNYYRISSMNSNMCLDVEGASTENNAGLVQNYCQNGASQQWMLGSGWESGSLIFIQAQHSNKVADISAYDINRIVQNQQDWSSNKLSQKWTFTWYHYPYCYLNPDNGMCKKK
jgi:hypothetical protein